jgi:4-hydroxybenzoate polyprenyltransferase
LIATAAAIGRIAATPATGLAEAVASSVWACLLPGAWAAAYLQSNYEKDRLGDVRAACRTLAHWLGLRASAALRLLAVCVVGWLAWREGLVAGLVALAAMAAAVLMISLSAAWVMRDPNEAVALQGYRFAVHGAVIGMLAMGSGVLGGSGTLAAVAVSALLTERAFHRHPRSA